MPLGSRRSMLRRKRGSIVPTKRCCCIKCVIFEDDFNRAELGSDYVGDGEIIDNVLHANNDTITICQAYELGAFYSRVTMKDTTDGAVYKVRCGDPDGGYLVTITFAGTVGIGTGTMQFSISTDDGATEVSPRIHCMATSPILVGDQTSRPAVSSASIGCSGAGTPCSMLRREPNR